MTGVLKRLTGAVFGRRPARGEEAGAALTSYATRLRAAADAIGQPHSEIFWDMAAHLERIRREVMDDPADLVRARRFVGHHAGVIVDLVERFVSLDAKARPEQRERLDQMAALDAQW